MGSIVQDGFNVNARVLYFSTFIKFRHFQNRVVKVLEIKTIDEQVVNPIQVLELLLNFRFLINEISFLS
jgi:hypothetical protein